MPISYIFPESWAVFPNGRFLPLGENDVRMLFALFPTTAAPLVVDPRAHGTSARISTFFSCHTSEAEIAQWARTLALHLWYIAEHQGQQEGSTRGWLDAFLDAFQKHYFVTPQFDALDSVLAHGSDRDVRRAVQQAFLNDFNSPQADRHRRTADQRVQAKMRSRLASSTYNNLIDENLFINASSPIARLFSMAEAFQARTFAFLWKTDFQNYLRTKFRYEIGSNLREGEKFELGGINSIDSRFVSVAILGEDLLVKPPEVGGSHPFIAFGRPTEAMTRRFSDVGTAVVSHPRLIASLSIEETYEYVRSMLRALCDTCGDELPFPVASTNALLHAFNNSASNPAPSHMFHMYHAALQGRLSEWMGGTYNRFMTVVRRRLASSAHEISIFHDKVMSPTVENIFKLITQPASDVTVNERAPIHFMLGHLKTCQQQSKMSHDRNGDLNTIYLTTCRLDPERADYEQRIASSMVVEVLEALFKWPKTVFAHYSLDDPENPYAELWSKVFSTYWADPEFMEFVLGSALASLFKEHLSRISIDPTQLETIFLSQASHDDEGKGYLDHVFEMAPNGSIVPNSEILQMARVTPSIDRYTCDQVAGVGLFNRTWAMPSAPLAFAGVAVGFEGMIVCLSLVLLMMRVRSPVLNMLCLMVACTIMEQLGDEYSAQFGFNP